MLRASPRAPPPPVAAACTVRVLALAAARGGSLLCVRQCAVAAAATRPWLAHPGPPLLRLRERGSSPARCALRASRRPWPSAPLRWPSASRATPPLVPPPRRLSLLSATRAPRRRSRRLSAPCALARLAAARGGGLLRARLARCPDALRLPLLGARLATRGVSLLPASSSEAAVNSARALACCAAAQCGRLRLSRSRRLSALRDQLALRHPSWQLSVLRALARLNAARGDCLLRASSRASPPVGGCPCLARASARASLPL